MKLTQLIIVVCLAVNVHFIQAADYEPLKLEVPLDSHDGGSALGFRCDHSNNKSPRECYLWVVMY